MKWPAHPAAELFPMMGSAEFAALVEDVRKNGVVEPIVLHEGSVLDGRNRAEAAEAVGITDPPTVQWAGKGSPVEWVISKNLHRRHLNETQRALIGAAAKGMFEAEAKERMTAGAPAKVRANLPEGVDAGRAREKAAALVNVSPRSVEHASKVLERGSEALVGAVRDGTVAVSKASKVATMFPKEQQDAFVEAERTKPKPVPATNDSGMKVVRREPPTAFSEAPKLTMLADALMKAKRTWRGMVLDWNEGHRFDMAFATRRHDEAAELIERAEAIFRELATEASAVTDRAS